MNTKKRMALLILMLALLTVVLIGCYGLTCSHSSEETPTHGHETNRESIANWDSLDSVVTDETTEQTTKLTETEAQTTHTHKFGKWTIVTAPTHTDSGQQERQCACGAKQTETVAPKGHSFGKWMTVTAPTCTEKGLLSRTCSCGASENKTSDPNGHTKITIGATEATCATDGYTEGERCAVCDLILKKQERIPASHRYQSTTVKPTCNSDGYTRYTCTRCQMKYDADRKVALGHAFENGVCTRCDEIQRINMRTRIGAPIGNEFIGKRPTYGSSDDYSLDFEAKNISGKDIKYITLKLEFYNKVGDVAYACSYKFTGPYEAGETFRLTTNNFGNNYSLYSHGVSDLRNISKLRISEIKVEYFDGTTELGDYGYDSTERKA